MGRYGEEPEDNSGMHVQLLSQACHFIFSDKQSKKETYRQLGSDGVVYIFDCGLDGFEYLGDRCMTDGGFATMDHLLEKLQQILTIGCNGDTTHPLQGKTINTVIVDNISVYYWDLKLMNHDANNGRLLGYANETSGTGYYTKLWRVLHQIQAKYKCNIVTSSWNNTYEKGYKYTGPTGSEPTTLDSVTFLPHKYLVEFDYLIHKSEADNAIYNKLAGQWTRVA